MDYAKNKYLPWQLKDKMLAQASQSTGHVLFALLFGNDRFQSFNVEVEINSREITYHHSLTLRETHDLILSNFYILFHRADSFDVSFPRFRCHHRFKCYRQLVFEGCHDLKSA